MYHKQLFCGYEVVSRQAPHKIRASTIIPIRRTGKFSQQEITPRKQQNHIKVRTKYTRDCLRPSIFFPISAGPSRKEKHPSGNLRSFDIPTAGTNSTQP